jgi:acyl carrier protein
MFDEIKAVIAETLSVDEDKITLEASLTDDLGADSLDVFQIIMGVEEKLNIEVDTDAAEKLSTVGDAVELIKKTVANK